MGARDVERYYEQYKQVYGVEAGGALEKAKAES